jgi:hypothetical protein
VYCERSSLDLPELATYTADSAGRFGGVLSAFSNFSRTALAPTAVKHLQIKGFAEQRLPALTVSDAGGWEEIEE